MNIWMYAVLLGRQTLDDAVSRSQVTRGYSDAEELAYTLLGQIPADKATIVELQFELVDSEVTDTIHQPNPGLTVREV